MLKWLREGHVSLEELLLFVGVLGGTVWVQKPSRFSFFGDSWDVLYAFLLDKRTILQPHNEHFIPLFNAFYYVQYRIFGAHHLGYMLVLYALHSLAAVLLFCIGRQIGLSKWSSAAAVLIFAFSSVAWEVTGWSFEQSFALGVVFVLATLNVFLSGAAKKRSRTLFHVALLSVLGYWAGGPIVLVLPLAITVYWIICSLASYDPVPWTLVCVLPALWAPAAFYYLTVRIAVRYTSQLPLHPIFYPQMHLHLRDLPAMIDFSLFGTVWGMVLPTLTFIHPQAVLSTGFILILVAIVTVTCYRGLLGKEQLCFWLLTSMTVGAYSVISLGRLQYGVAIAASSRYQYLSSASFALLLSLCWQGFRRVFVNDHTPVWWHVFSVLLLAYLLAFHIKTTRVENIDADRGSRVQEFLRAVRNASFPSQVPSRSVVLGADFQVPPYVIPPRRPLWMILQVLKGNTHDVVPVENYLSTENELVKFNLIPNGGFEEPLSSHGWQTLAGAQFSWDTGAKRDGEYGVHLSLPQRDSAFANDAVHNCSPSVSGKVFTFAVQAETGTPAALIARITFKAADGKLLATYASEPHAGDGQWHQLVTGGLSPPGTCTVSVDVSNGALVGLNAAIDDTLLLLHPGIVDADGVPSFQPPQEISNRR